MNKMFHIDDICTIVPQKYTLFVAKLFCESPEKFQTIMQVLEKCQRNYRRGIITECEYDYDCSQVMSKYM